MLHYILFLSFFYSVFTLPLQQSSLISLRTTSSSPSGGNQSPLVYRELLLEEWSSTYEFVQNWSVPCTLPGISSETLTEGLLRSRYPFGDGIWFLCRDVPVGNNISYTPAPVLMMNLQEDGNLIQWASDTTSYPAGTSTNMVLNWYDSILDNYVFYLLGGLKPAGAGTLPRPAQPRLRIDTGPGTPPDVQGALANIATNVNPTAMTIMTDSLYIPAVIPNATASSFFSIYLVGTENTLPINTRSVVSYAVYNEPLMLSVWTFPFIDVIWYTGFNRVPYLARTNFSITDPSQMTIVLPLPASSSSGTLGGPSWRVSTARFEGDYYSTGDTVYLNNGTDIYKNTIVGLVQGLPYQSVLHSPPGWKFMDVHARQLFLPSPTATPTASSTSSASATATASASATATTTASASSSSTSSPTSTSTVSASVSSSFSSQPTYSSSASSSASSSPSATSSKGLPPPVPPTPDANSVVDNISPGGAVGITFGTILGSVGMALLIFRFVPGLRSHFVRFFGMSSSNFPKNLPKRKGIVSGMPMEISQNPYAIAQQRVEQLRSFQKKNADTELKKYASSRSKKEFAPTQTTEVVSVDIN